VTRFALLARLALVASMAALFAPACSLGQGSGSGCGWLDVPDCWSGVFRLYPDFFAAIPTNSAALEIRIQNGIDYETYSDGIVIQVADAALIRGDPLPGGMGMPRPGLLGQPLPVSLPPGVTPPGVPLQANPNPPLVYATAYLNRTCRTQNVALQATTCTVPARLDMPVVCDIEASAGGLFEASVGGNPDASGSGGDAGASGGVGASTITFHSLFDGNVNESDAKQRLTDADFDFYLADPRDGSPGGLGPPPPCRGRIKGSFHFYFERGRPAQPFP
jgi:hypothetical protein